MTTYSSFQLQFTVLVWHICVSVCKLFFFYSSKRSRGCLMHSSSTTLSLLSSSLSWTPIGCCQDRWQILALVSLGWSAAAEPCQTGPTKPNTFGKDLKKKKVLSGSVGSGAVWRAEVSSFQPVQTAGRFQRPSGQFHGGPAGCRTGVGESYNLS